MKTLSIILAAISLTGCVSNGITLGVESGTPSHAIEATEKRFVGIPPLLAAEGSAVYLGNGWYVTAEHNKLILGAQMLDVVYHPTCDIALFRDTPKNMATTKLGMIRQGETTHTVGYPLSMPISASYGEYVGDFFEPDAKCLYSATTSKVTSGMSGGGVWNDKGELVGIIRGVTSGEVKWEDGRTAYRPSAFTSVYVVREWIYKVTGMTVIEE